MRGPLMMFPTRRILPCLNTARNQICTTSVSFKDKEIKNKKPPLVEANGEDSKKLRPKFSSNISEEEQKQAKEKLKLLLQDVEREPAKPEAPSVFDFIKPEKQNSKKIKRVPRGFEEAIIKGVEDVAKEMRGNTVKTTSELMESLEKFTILKKNKDEGVDSKKVSSLYKGRPKYLHGADPIADLPEPLGIFDVEEMKKAKDTGIKLKIWDELEEFHLKSLTAAPPRNYFEEQILWTEKGKLWLFPIDNDQGRDEEASVDFTQHVFLEDHLEPWCPKRGPLKKFMELVITGLSKNPYLTVEEKIEHIYWYRDYFEEKKKLLMELGALSSVKEISQPKLEDNETEPPK